MNNNLSLFETIEHDIPSVIDRVRNNEAVKNGLPRLSITQLYKLLQTIKYLDERSFKLVVGQLETNALVYTRFYEAIASNKYDSFANVIAHEDINTVILEKCSLYYMLTYMLYRDITKSKSEYVDACIDLIVVFDPEKKECLEVLNTFIELKDFRKKADEVVRDFNLIYSDLEKLMNEIHLEFPKQTIPNLEERDYGAMESDGILWLHKLKEQVEVSAKSDIPKNNLMVNVHSENIDNSEHNNENNILGSSCIYNEIDQDGTIGAGYHFREYFLKTIILYAGLVTDKSHFWGFFWMLYTSNCFKWSELVGKFRGFGPLVTAKS